MLDASDRQAQGRQDTGQRRDDHVRHRLLRSEAPAMDRAGSAEQNESEVARVVASADRDQTYRIGHLRVDQAVDPGGRA